MPDARLVALAALATGLACAAAPAPPCDPGSAPQDARFARVEVAIAPAGASLDAEAAARLVALVRQSARDWLELRGRTAPDGELSLIVTVDSVRLRSAWVTTLFAWAAPPDHLAARVSLRRAAEREPRCDARVESALAGWSWRDPELRLDRLARRLGQRVAEGL